MTKEKLNQKTVNREQNKSEDGKRKRAPKTSQIERTKSTVLDTTTELLGEVVYGRLTVDLISERSGVSRSTIYRYWKTLPELVSDAFDRALGPDPKLPDDGPIRGQLLTHFNRWPKTLNKSIWSRVLPALIAANSNDSDFAGRLYKIADKRKKIIRHIVEGAIERGELKPDTDSEWMIDLLSGIFYYRRLITGASLHQPKLVEMTVDAVLTSVLAPGHTKD